MFYFHSPGPLGVLDESNITALGFFWSSFTSVFDSMLNSRISPRSLFASFVRVAISFLKSKSLSLRALSNFKAAELTESAAVDTFAKAVDRLCGNSFEFLVSSPISSSLLDRESENKTLYFDS
jgi:hypothetical protein